MIEISKLAAVSGQPGLYHITTALKNGVILESLDDARTRIVAGTQSRVSVLSEISIYTTSAEGSVPLEQVLKSAFSIYGAGLKVNPKSDAADLKSFLLSVLKDADTERVYTSDIKKLVSWYQTLLKYAPEVLSSGEEPVVSEAKEEGKPKAKKAAAKKA
jgi:hypothetical protein